MNRFPMQIAYYRFSEKSGAPATIPTLVCDCRTKPNPSFYENIKAYANVFNIAKQISKDGPVSAVDMQNVAHVRTSGQLTWGKPGDQMLVSFRDTEGNIVRTSRWQIPEDGAGYLVVPE